MIAIQFFQAAATVIPTLTVALVVTVGYPFKTNETLQHSKAPAERLTSHEANSDAGEDSCVQSPDREAITVYVLTVALVSIGETACLIALALGGAGNLTALLVTGIILAIVALIMFEKLRELLAPAAPRFRRTASVAASVFTFVLPMGVAIAKFT